MKILVLTDGLPPVVFGGAGRIALNDSVALVQKGHTVTIVTPAKQDSLKEEQGVKIRTIQALPQRFAHFRSVFSQTRADEIVKIIEEEQPDLIHAHTIAWQIGYRWMKDVRIPIIFTAHDVMTVAYGKVRGDEACLWWKDLCRVRWNWNPLRNIAIRKYLGRCKAVLCVSDALRTYLAMHSIPHLQTLHNGIDTSFYHPICSKEEARTKLSLPHDKTIFLLAGRLGHDKGTTLVNEALPDDAHLAVAGDIEETAFPRIKDRLHCFRGQGPDYMRLLYAACNATLVPSVYLDPFPTVCLESQACGRLVIVTNMGGAKEAVLDGKTGYIFDPRDKAGFAFNMMHTMHHPDETLHHGQAARMHMEAHFSMQKHIDKLEQLYTDILSV